MSIKKCTSLFLTLLLLVSNIGMAFNVHFCGDEIASITLKATENVNLDSDCCKIIAGNENHCCKDKVVNFQKNSENTIVKVVLKVPNVFLLNAKPSFDYANLVKEIRGSKISSYAWEANPPPLFTLYSQYIFYA